LAKLEELYIDNTQIKDLSPISGLRNLKILVCSNTPVADLSPLKGMTELEVLDIRTGTGVKDLSPLKNCTSLEYLIYDSERRVILEPQVKELEKAIGRKLRQDWN
jgi:internalin A